MISKASGAVSLTSKPLISCSTSSESGSPLVELPQHHVYLRVNDKKAAVKDQKVLEVVDRIGAELGSMGRVLVRHSDTESIVRIMVESESWDKCRKYADQIVEALRSGGYLI